MREMLRKYGGEIYRGLLSLFTLLIAVFTRGETERIVPFAVAYVLLLCVGLMVLPRTRYLNLPFLLLTLMVLPCYNSADIFIKYVWLVPVALGALTFHLLRLRPRMWVGPTFLPLAAVTVATMLGGLGIISSTEYFRPTALAYVVGLGPGLLLVYWIMKNEATEAADEEGLFSDLFWWGITAALMVLCHMLPRYWQDGIFPVIQWSNNVATMMMIALPAIMLKAKRCRPLWLCVLLLLGGIFVAGCRGGILLVPFEFLACFIWIAHKEENKVARRVYRILLAVGGGLAAILLLCTVIDPGWLTRFNASLTFYNPEETRWKLLARGFEDLLEYPLFGTGLGYLGNSDLYNGREGTINWYHIFPAQIAGSLGLCGILAWGWQLWTRFCLSLRSMKKDTFVLSLCYFGLLLISMVNPGEFCPAPYAFLAVWFFALMENRLFGADHETLYILPRRPKKVKEKQN